MMRVPLTFITLLVGLVATIKAGLVSDFCRRKGLPLPSSVDLPSDFLHMSYPPLLISLMNDLPRHIVDLINDLRIKDGVPMFDILTIISHYHKDSRLYKKWTPGGDDDVGNVDLLQYAREASLVCDALASMWRIKDHRGNWKDNTEAIIEGQLLHFEEAPKVDCMLLVPYYPETHFDVIPFWHEGDFSYFFLATKEGKLLDMIASSKRGEMKNGIPKKRTIHLLNRVDTTWSKEPGHEMAWKFFTGEFEADNFSCKKTSSGKDKEKIRNTKKGKHH